MALPFSRRPAAEPRRVREAGARQDTPQCELRATPLSLQLLQPYLGERIQRRLLRLSVDRDARRRRLPMVRRARRTYPRQWRSLSPDDPFAGKYRRPRQNVRELARRTTQCEGDAEVPGAGGICSGQIATTATDEVRYPSSCAGRAQGNSVCGLRSLGKEIVPALFRGGKQLSELRRAPQGR